MDNIITFRPKMPLATKLTRLGHFDVVRRPSGTVSIEFMSEHLDEYSVGNFTGLAEDAAEAVEIAKAFQDENS